MKVCKRCDGSGEEPGAPIEEDGATALCDACFGTGKAGVKARLEKRRQAALAAPKLLSALESLTGRIAELGWQSFFRREYATAVRVIALAKGEKR